MCPASLACPVCGLPIREQGRCRCGWTLRSDWSVGFADRPAFEARLAGARLAHDLAAAVRAGFDRRTGVPFVRGTPAEADWDQGEERPAIPVRPLRPALEAAVTSLAAGQVLAVVEIDARNVTITRVETAKPDTGGTRTERWSRPMHDVLPMLNPGADRLRFQLAGGLAGVDRAEVSRRLAAWADGLLAASGLRDDAVLVAVNHNPGWTVPDEMIDLLGRRHRRQVWFADEGAVEPVLAEVLAAQPLRTSYGLLVADVADDGRVRLVTRPLFAPGAHAGKTATVTVRCPPYGADRDCVLAVVSGTSALVGAWAARLPPGGPIPVEVELAAPGRVRLITPAQARPDRRGLAELKALAPARIEVPGRPVEIICLVELNGPEDAVRRRRKLLAELFDLLMAEPTAAAGIALFGYTDHYALDAADEPVVQGRWLGTPAQAQDTLATFPAPASRWNKNAAPLEDALHEVDARCARRPVLRPRILLVVAARPPHPAVISDVPRPAQRCPDGWDWTAYVRRFGAAGIGVRLAVLDEPPRPRDDTWRPLGFRTVEPLATATARGLAEAMALVTPNPVHLPFPLADQPQG
ncbi:hypothetical protein [Nonomuraea sp. NPDC049625]|uniref:hypothetical protein n=1 Tax=Nonomuraea sp. NPDC049625 TaxID=3155775 RepID=UPI003429C6D5